MKPMVLRRTISDAEIQYHSGYIRLSYLSPYSDGTELCWTRHLQNLWKLLWAVHLESVLEYLEDPDGFESDCQLRYDEEAYEYSFVLSDGEKSLEYEVDYYDLSDMIVAVEIIDYQDSGRTTLIEEDADCEFFEEDDRD